MILIQLYAKNLANLPYRLKKLKIVKHIQMQDKKSLTSTLRKHKLILYGLRRGFNNKSR